MKHRKPRPRRSRRRFDPGSLLAQPPRQFYFLPELEIRGGLIITDGCRRVLDFTPQTICLDLGEGIVTLYGQELRIESLSGKRLVAAGRVHRIELKNKWGTDHETL